MKQHGSKVLPAILILLALLLGAEIIVFCLQSGTEPETPEAASEEETMAWGVQEEVTAAVSSPAISAAEQQNQEDSAEPDGGSLPKKKSTPPPVLSDYVYCAVDDTYRADFDSGYTLDLYCKIPQFKFDTPDAEEYNADIWSLTYEPWEQQKQIPLADRTVDSYIDADYEAWLTNDVVVVHLDIIGWEWGWDYYYILDAKTGQSMTSAELGNRFNLSGNMTDHVRETMRNYIIGIEDDISATEWEQSLTWSLAADNVRNSVVFPDQDGQLMVYCHIYNDVFDGLEGLRVLPLI